jgi:hypothetical protein
MYKSSGSRMKMSLASLNDDKNSYDINICFSTSNVRNALNAKAAFVYSTAIAKPIRASNSV